MIEGFDERLARIVAGHRAWAAQRIREEPGPERERRLAHERVVAELPRLVSRMTRVVVALNDRLGGEGVMVVLSSAEHRMAAEAAYTLGLADDVDADPRLLLSVDWSGTAYAVLTEGETRKAMLICPVFELDDDRLTELVLGLLEARFGCVEDDGDDSHSDH